MPLFAVFVVSYLHFPANYLVKFVLLIVLIIRSKHFHFINRATMLFGLFAAYITISDIFVGNITQSYYLMKNEAIWFFIMLIIISNSNSYKLSNYILSKKILYIIIVVSAIVSVIQVFIPFFFLSQLYIGENIDSIGSIINYRLPSIFSWSSRQGVGLTFIPILAILIGSLYKGKNRKLLLMVYLLGAIVAFLSKSRYVYVAYFFVLAMNLFYDKSYSIVKYFKFIFIGLFISVLLYMFLDLIGFNIVDVIRNRIFEDNLGGVLNGSAGTRINAFYVFFDLFPKNPIFGTGNIMSYELKKAVSNIRSSQIHVGYLSLFYYYGIIGGFLYLSFLYTIMSSLHKNAKLYNNYGPFVGFGLLVWSNFTLVDLVPFEAGIFLCLIFDRVYYLDYKFNKNRKIYT
jgi:hypothetical protein